MHIKTLIAELKRKRHVVGEDEVMRLGVCWLTVDGVSMTETQARAVVNGSKTVDQIDSANRKRTGRSLTKRPIARSRR